MTDQGMDIQGIEDNNAKTILKISFVNQNLNFSKVSWCVIYEQLIKISNSWTFVAFADKFNSAIISEDSLNIHKLINNDSITIGNDVIAVECSKIKENSKKGIIYSPMTIPLSSEFLVDKLYNQGVEEVFKIQKIDNKYGDKYFTGSVILVFSETSEVNEIKIDGVVLQLNQLTPRPMLCRHCGLIGHTILKCNKKNIIICRDCFNCHQDCEECIISCKNCQGGHKSDDKSCPAIIQEVKILKIRDTHNINYNDAKFILSKNQIESLDIVFAREQEIVDARLANY